MSDPTEYNPTVSGYGTRFPGKSVADADDVPDHLRNLQTGRSRWAEGVAGRGQISPAKPVVGPDGAEIGLVKEVHDDYLLVEREGADDVYVPYDAVLDVTGNRVELRETADRVATLGWDRPR